MLHCIQILMKLFSDIFFVESVRQAAKKSSSLNGRANGQGGGGKALMARQIFFSPSLMKRTFKKSVYVHSS